MTRLIFFTGQRELDKSSVRIDTAVGPDGVTRCSGMINDLPEHLPEGAHIILEAYNSMYLHRMDLGPARSTRQFPSRTLDRLPADSRVRFRVKIVHRDPEGLPVLLAARDHIKTLSEEAQGESILPVRGKTNAELRGELWRVEDGHYGNGDYELWINSEAGSLLADVKGGKSSLLGLVLPMAVRIILERLFVEPESRASDEVRDRWLQMGEIEFGMERIDPSIDDHEAKQVVHDWVEKFIENMCRKHYFAASYVSQGMVAQGGDA